MADGLAAAQRAGWEWPCEVRPLDPPGSSQAMRRVFVVPTHVLLALALWSRAVHLRLSAIAPSWQVVLDAPEVRHPSVRGVMLADRDGVSSIIAAADRGGCSTTVGALSDVALARLAERTCAEHGWPPQALRGATWMRTPADPAVGRVAQAHGWEALGAIEWWG